MSPRSGTSCCPGDPTDAFAALVDQYRALTARIGSLEANTTVVGNTGPAGPPGPAGPAGATGACDCAAVEAEIAALTKRLEAVEHGATADPAHSLGPYYDLVLADGPVGFWPLCEVDPTSRVFYDHSGNHLTGTIDDFDATRQNRLFFMGTPCIPSQPSDHSMTVPLPPRRFDAIPCYGRVFGLEAFINDTAGQSIEFWVRIAAGWTDNPTLQYKIRSYLHFGGTFGDYDLSLPDFGDGANRSCFCEYQATLPDGVMPGVLAPGESGLSDPHHVVYTRRSGGQYRIYIDGVQAAYRPAGSFALTAPGSTLPVTLSLGGNSFNDAFFMGNLAYVSIFNKELTADQVHAHYLAAIS